MVSAGDLGLDGVNDRAVYEAVGKGSVVFQRGHRVGGLARAGSPATCWSIASAAVNEPASPLSQEPAPPR